MVSWTVDVSSNRWFSSLSSVVRPSLYREDKVVLMPHSTGWLIGKKIEGQEDLRKCFLAERGSAGKSACIFLVLLCCNYSNDKTSQRLQVDHAHLPRAGQLLRDIDIITSAAP